MSLVLTRRPGEGVIILGPDGVACRRLVVVSIENNVVRLAFDAPEAIRIIREELLTPQERILYDLVHGCREEERKGA